MMPSHIRFSVASLFRMNSSFSCNSNARFSLYFVYFSTSTESQPAISPVVYLQNYNFSPQVFLRAASVLSRSKNPEKSKLVLSFLKERGFTDTQLEKIVNYKPDYLMANVEKVIEPKLKIFRDLGFGEPEIAKIISQNPSMLSRSISKRIIPSLSILQGLIGSNALVIKILRRCDWFLMLDLNKTTVPNFEFLKSCGVPAKHIARQISYFPRFILLKPEIMRKSVEKVDEIGIDRSSSRFIYAVGVVSLLSEGGWELKLKTFQKFGFSEEEILDMFQRVPQIFSVSEKKIGNVIEVLLATGKYTMLCIFRYPKSLMYSVETRYKPRIRALEVLEKSNRIKKWPSVGTICKISDTQFFGTCIHPFE